MIQVMRKRRLLGWVALGLALLILFGPFLIPVPPLEGTLPAAELAASDSQFVTAAGLQFHYKSVGGGEPTFILLHGFGASVFTWRKVLEPLGELGRVVAYDRPGFGLTERPREWTGANPYSKEVQDEQLIALMAALGIERAILVGNSAGGSAALQTALNYPDRVEALVLVDAAVYTEGGTPAWAAPLLRTPQVDRLGPLLARGFAGGGESLQAQAWHEPSRITAADRAGYEAAYQVNDWDWAFWEFIKASAPLGLAEGLGELSLPVLVITGDDDRIVPTADSLRLAEEIPGAELAVLAACGHVPQEECPTAFLDAVQDFIPD